MNETNWVPALASVIALIVTVIGWSTTHFKQMELAFLQGQLQKSISEHDTRFAYLHKRRGEVIDQVYKRTNKILRTCSLSANHLRFASAPLGEDELKQLFQDVEEFTDYYSDNRLYLDLNLCEPLERFFQHLGEVAVEIGSASELAQGDKVLADRMGLPQLAHMSRQQAQLAANIIGEDLAPVRGLIEKQMRAILGSDR